MIKHTLSECLSHLFHQEINNFFYIVGEISEAKSEMGHFCIHLYAGFWLVPYYIIHRDFVAIVCSSKKGLAR